MYVCVYVCMYVCMYVCILSHTFINTAKDTLDNIITQKYIHTRNTTCTHQKHYTSIEYDRIKESVFKNARAHTHSCIHRYTHTYMYAYMCGVGCLEYSIGV